MISIAEIIKSRRTVHSYEHLEVPDDILNEGLALSLWAPNHKMTRPWKFIRVVGDARQDLAEIAVALKAKKDQLTEIKKTAIANKFLHEGSLIFFAQTLAGDPTKEQEDYATLACAIQNFSLFMWHRGLGTKWSSGGIIRDSKVYQLLELDSSTCRLVGMVWAGKPKQIPTAQARGDLSDYFKTIGNQA